MNKQISLLILLLVFFNFPVFGKTIVFLGDSLSAGYGVEKLAAYPELVVKELKKSNLEIKMINASESGATTSVGLTRLNWILKQKVDVVILALGGNDALRGHDVKHTKNNLLKMIELAKSKKAKIVLAGMQAPRNMGEKFTKQFDKIFSELAEKYKLIYFPFLLKGVAAKKEFNISDGIHPNEEGHKIMAKNILPYVKEALGAM